MSLVVVGTMAYDAIETPFGKVDRILGGAATHFALAASYFIKPVKAISVVGNDFAPEDKEMMKAHGIDFEGVEVNPDGKCFFWAGRYHADMNTRDTLATELNVLATFEPKIPASYQDCEYLMLGNLTPDIQRQVIEGMHKRPKLVVLDTMNYWIENTRESLDEALKLADVLVINDEEARQLTGEYSLRKAAKQIMATGPTFLIIKKGEHGALLFHEDEVFSAPGMPLEEVFDPTGAGDAFAGGFVGYLAKTDDISFDNLKRAIIYGSALASFIVEEFGPRKLVQLSDEAIQARIQDFVKLANFDIS